MSDEPIDRWCTIKCAPKDGLVDLWVDDQEGGRRITDCQWVNDAWHSSAGPVEQNGVRAVYWMQVGRPIAVSGRRWSREDLVHASAMVYSAIEYFDEKTRGIYRGLPPVKDETFVFDPDTFMVEQYEHFGERILESGGKLPVPGLRRGLE